MYVLSTAGYLLYASINSTVHLVALGGAYEDVVESVANITEVTWQPT
jgi:hypothetical protein